MSCFRDVEVIDDDLGISANGAMERPGFERLCAWLCAARVGAVLCFDASRLSRNGRDWHHLLELCGLFDARVIDMDGIYDPRLPNDRLLLGMKGSIFEFETGVLRARMLDALREKACRGELRLNVPIGYVWHREGGGPAFNPDLRIQETIRLIFAGFRELGSARQVALVLNQDKVCFPAPYGRALSPEWRPLSYSNVRSVLKNPFYAGVYAWGKTGQHTDVVDGRVRKRSGRERPVEEWEVLLKDHHPGYIDWTEYESNQVRLASNSFSKTGGSKSGRGGRALLSGLLSCARCGRRLQVSYSLNCLIDMENAVIVDVEAKPTRISKEVEATETMLDRCRNRFGLAPNHIAGDVAYGTAKLLDGLVGRAIEPHIPVWDRSRRDGAILSRNDFTFESEDNVYVCP